MSFASKHVSFQKDFSCMCLGTYTHRVKLRQNNLFYSIAAKWVEKQWWAFYHPWFNPVNNLICCSRTALIWVVKGAMSLFNSFCSNAAGQDACFLWLRTKHKPWVHGPPVMNRIHRHFFKKSKGEMNNKHYGRHQPTEISQPRFGGVDRWYLLSFPVSLSIFEFMIASSWDTSW